MMTSALFWLFIRVLLLLLFDGNDRKEKPKKPAVPSGCWQMGKANILLEVIQGVCVLTCLVMRATFKNRQAGPCATLQAGFEGVLGEGWGVTSTAVITEHCRPIKRVFMFGLGIPWSRQEVVSGGKPSSQMISCERKGSDKESLFGPGPLQWKHWEHSSWGYRHVKGQKITDRKSDY